MAENATLNDDALLQIFQRGLKGRLYDRIMNTETPPKTLEEWYDKARKQEDVLRQIAAHKGYGDEFSPGYQKMVDLTKYTSGRKHHREKENEDPNQVHARAFHPKRPNKTSLLKRFKSNVKALPP